MYVCDRPPLVYDFTGCPLPSGFKALPPENYCTVRYDIFESDLPFIHSSVHQENHRVAVAVLQEFQVFLEFLVPRGKPVWQVPKETMAPLVQLVHRETRAIQEVKGIQAQQAPEAIQGPWEVTGNSACSTS